MRVRAAISALALLCLAPAAASAAEEPEAVYAKFHRALAAGNIDEMQRYANAARRAELARMSPAQKQATAKLMGTLVPRTYQLRDKTLSPDSKAARLVFAGLGAPIGAGPAPTMYGTVRMTVEGGDWKVIEANWSPDSPALLSPAYPGGAYAPPRPGAKTAPPSAAAPAPGIRPAPAQTPRAAPIVGSITGAPERKLGTAKPPCVYKPVMTGEDLENCR